MVIQCSECQTRFKLADDKMQPEGIKVRCAKCKHVFKVFPPAPVTAPAAPAARPEAEAETSFSGLLDEESPREFSLGRQDADRAHRTEATPEEAFSWGEEPPQPAWEDFAVGAPEATPATGPDPAEGSLRDAFDLDAGPAQPSEEVAGRAVELDIPSDLGSSAEEAAFDFAEGPTLTADDFDLGPTEPGDSSQEDETAPEEEFAFGVKDEASFDDLLGDEGGGDFAEPEGLPNLAEEFAFAETGDASAEEKAFDFGGEADTLDFADLGTTPQKDMSWDDLEADAFGDDFDLDPDQKQDKEFEFTDLGFQEEARDDSLGDEDFGSISLQTPPALETAPPATIAPSPAPPEPAERPSRSAPPPAAAAPPRQGPLRRLVLFVLGLLLALSGAAGYFAWQNGGIAPLIDRLTGTPAAPVVQPQVRLSGLNGYFVTNKDAGQLFVIQGQATNDYPEARSAMTVKGSLYDKGGKLLVQQTVFCGNRLDDAALQELSFDKISEAMNNQFGDTLSNLNVAPGKSLPFTVVFRDLPPDLAEFTVEPIDSRPGSN